jgi:hypothetical protein
MNDIVGFVHINKNATTCKGAENSNEFIGQTLLPAGRFISRKFKNNKMNKYKEIKFGFGNIESAVKELKSHNELVCGSFNGQMLYSDIDDLDSAYVKITGKTKAEFDEAERIRHEEYKAEEKRHKDAIPELIKEWIEKGNTILDEKYRETWAKCVPIRLGDLYRGIELGACLDIVIELNNGCSLDDAKAIIEKQGHSGMSFGLVCSMVKSFCNRGTEFVTYVC